MLYSTVAHGRRGLVAVVRVSLICSLMIIWLHRNFLACLRLGVPLRMTTILQTFGLMCQP